MPARESSALSFVLLMAGAVPLIHPLAAEAQAVDSLIFRRLPGYWEDAPPRSERLAGYRVTISPAGELHFTVEHGTEAGQEERQAASADEVAPLFTLAETLDLEGVPERLAGAKPWCDIVATDAPSVAIGIARGDSVSWVVDNHGCTVDRDESEDQLIGRLRELERTTSRILDFDQRFDAVPLVDPNGEFQPAPDIVRACVKLYRSR